MRLTVEIPDDAKDVKVSVLCDGKQYNCQEEKRYSPGNWNGLHGGMYYGQYFDMEDVNRVKEMTEVASVLAEYGIKYILSKLKRKYRLMITNKDYFGMDETIKKRIWDINSRHDSAGIW